MHLIATLKAQLGKQMHNDGGGSLNALKIKNKTKIVWLRRTCRWVPLEIMTNIYKTQRANVPISSVA